MGLQLQPVFALFDLYLEASVTIDVNVLFPFLCKSCLVEVPLCEIISCGPDFFCFRVFLSCGARGLVKV